MHLFRPEVVNSLAKIHARGKARYSDVVKKSCVYKSDRGDSRLTIPIKSERKKVFSANTVRVDSTFVRKHPVKTVVPVKKFGNKVKNTILKHDFVLDTNNRFSVLQNDLQGLPSVGNRSVNVVQGKKSKPGSIAGTSKANVSTVSEVPTQ